MPETRPEGSDDRLEPRPDGPQATVMFDRHGSVTATVLRAIAFVAIASALILVFLPAALVAAGS
jgi:hypothetical protein